MNAFQQSGLLKSFNAGDQSAFETVFKTFYKPLRMQAFLLLKSKEDSEDLVQQLFLDIWNRELYRNINDSLKAYLFTAIRHRCYNFVRQSRRLQGLKEKFAKEDHSEVFFPIEEPLLEGRFRTALDSLPVQRGRAFELVYLEDKKYMQAALEMGISVNSLKSHLKLAVKFLRLKLQN